MFYHILLSGPVMFLDSAKSWWNLIFSLHNCFGCGLKVPDTFLIYEACLSRGKRNLAASLRNMHSKPVRIFDPPKSILRPFNRSKIWLKFLNPKDESSHWIKSHASKYLGWMLFFSSEWVHKFSFHQPNLTVRSEWPHWIRLIFLKQINASN